jgi:germination protein, Ger(x)C family
MKAADYPVVRIMLVSLAVLLVAPLLSGCWDRLELDDRAIVLGVSIDEVNDEELLAEESEVTHLRGTIPAPKKGMIRVGVQIALPGRIPLGPGEGGGGGGGGGETNDTIWVLDVVGHTIDDAFTILQQQVSSRLFFGHLRIIVVSEKIARKGMGNINDYFRRNPAVRRMAWMMVSKGKAREMLNASPKLERIPTLYLMSTLDNGIRLGKFPKDYIGQYWSNTSKLGQEGFLPYIDIKKEQNVEVSGIAYFKSEQMVGVTKTLEIAGYLGLRGVNPAGYRTFVILDKNDLSTAVMVNVRHRDVKWSLQIKDGIPHFTIKVELEVDLDEKYTSNSKVVSLSEIQKIEKQHEEVSVKAYENFLRKTQVKQSDFIGFGEYVRAKNPEFWKQHIRTKEDWQRMYKDVTFDIQVDVRLRRMGMKTQ